jgi:type IV pilus assembly protein PilY1
MFNQNEIDSYLQRFGYKGWLRVLAIGFCILTAAILFFGAMLAHAEIDLADVPMFTKINPPPPNLTILMDDSGSMTFEILVRGEYDGQFPNPDPGTTDQEGFCYVFDDMDDGYNINQSWRQMDAETRKYWRSQWHETNVVYYNPNVDYEPWPSHAKETFPVADKNSPLVHPLQKKKLDLDKTSFTVDLDVGGDGTVDGTLKIPWAHYFVRALDNTVYLVVMENGDVSYYTFTRDDGSIPNDKIETVTPVSVAPADIDRTYDEARQNFANWFTYERRREFVAKAAIARVVKKLDGVRVAILGINNKVIIPLKPVKAVIEGEFKDESDAIIETLYDYKSGGGTPLKKGLEKVGEYYRVNDGDLEGEKGDVPYPADGGACQQSFTIVVTDGFYSDTTHTSVGNADGDKDNADWGGGQQPYTDAFKDTLADIAMHYYATDLLPALDDKVPTNKWDGAPHQHMVTFAVAFGVSGTLNPEDYEDDRTSEHYMKYITKTEEPREYGDYVVWPEVPGAREPESIDDLWHATVNGRGVYVQAGQPKKLVEGLLGIIKDIMERQPTSVASVSVNGDRLFGKIGPDVLVFQGSFSYIDDAWAGEVSAYRLNQTTGQVITEPPEWLASEKLQAKAWNTRNILTFDGDTSGQYFIFNDLNDTQKDKLGSDPKKVVEFIRGKDPDSSGNRANMLGDIVHASPVFIDDVVYVGANDGMLHAFKASDGTEIFGYVPYLVFDHLKDLADPDYDHRFYVDLTPTVKKGETLLKSSGEQAILVGGLGKGGMGYFALDITNPNAMGEDQVLWEFPNKNTAAVHVEDMGYSFSKPVVVRSYKKQSVGGDYTWVVIAGNGYNSPNGNSVLFILDAATGEVIRKIEAGIGPDNGLSSPIAVDVDFDEVVDFVYAGDLLGNLWKFDLTSTEVTDWEVAYKEDNDGVPLFRALDADGDPQSITAKPDVMYHPETHGYIVCFGTGKFLGPSDFDDARLQTIYGIWDYGDRVFIPRLGWSDDDDSEFLGTFRVPNEAAQLSNQPTTVKLLKQEASEVKVGSGEDEVIVRVLTDEEPQWITKADSADKQMPDPSDETPNDAGWYLDLDVYSGERVISDVILRDGVLIVIGFIPEQNRCGVGGDSVFMELNAFTGGQLAGVNFDIHDDGSVGQDDYVEIEKDGETIYVPPSGLKLAGNIQPPAIIRLNETTEIKYLSSSGGGIVEITERAAKIGIAYWMELLQ